MNATDSKYASFGLVKDMLETPGVVARFDTGQGVETARAIRKVGRLFLTGEGSSRIFPAKQMMLQARRRGSNLVLHTEAGLQSREYDLRDWAVFAASNSGRTSEVIKLFTELKAKGHSHLYGLTAGQASKLADVAGKTYVLTCGGEGAVAATKSVVEQALFYHALYEATEADTISSPLSGELKNLAAQLTEALTLSIDPALTEKIARAGTIYFAGRNDGVAEELALKTNEITRKKSDYLEGTYAVHGIEEVMSANDVVIWVDPYPDSYQKFADVLVKGVGLTVIALSTVPTPFPTIGIPSAGALQSYVNLCAGWNVLVEAGIQLNINLDKPERARKVGNEFVV